MARIQNLFLTKYSFPSHKAKQNSIPESIWETLNQGYRETLKGEDPKYGKICNIHGII
jgi:hypothetical protein